mmetsp:Transcript_6269/g.7779  ORF Transcript_6269/g.7779 Transcript_6269/m.7779 type:complete len:221 (+) Transcript_6269:43-705(+)
MTQKFEVESIDGEMFDTNENKLYYLVNWLGYSDSDKTWEESSNVKDTDIYKEYIKKISWNKGDYCHIKINKTNKKNKGKSKKSGWKNGVILNIDKTKRLIDVSYDNGNKIQKNIAFGDERLRKRKKPKQNKKSKSKKKRKKIELSSNDDNIDEIPSKKLKIDSNKKSDDNESITTNATFEIVVDPKKSTQGFKIITKEIEKILDKNDFKNLSFQFNFMSQ